MPRPRKNPLFITKICVGCQKEFNISSRKRRQKYCSKSCAQHDPSVLNKMRISQQKTWDEKYNGNHPMTTEKTKNNFLNSIFKKYGNDFYKNYLNKKTKETKLIRYGNENYNNIEKIRKTCLEKYGVDNSSQVEEIINKRRNTKYQKHFNFIVEYCKKKNIIPLFSFDEYKGYMFQNKYQFKCGVCQHIFETDIYKPHHVFCETCSPTDRNTLEDQLFKFLSEILPPDTIIKRNDRTVLYGKELDIYIPSKQIAFELNGLYWHSEFGRGITKFYHINKTKNCIFHSIKLFHIFENEWISQPEIVKSIIKNILNVGGEKIYARKCEIRNVSNNEKNVFLENNHIQGSDLSSVRYGLYYNNKLVSIMTFSKPRFDRSVEWEIVRYCNLLNHRVIGGASKLFKHFIDNNHPKSIISYSDRRYFEGNVYNNLSFKFIHHTPPNYYYISSDYKQIFNRMTFQKHKQKKLLENFNASLSEWENMKNNGFDRIWDCGNNKWLWQSKI